MKAPFTPQQVEALNKYQNCGIWHPFTCGNCRNVLTATEKGWICSQCDYTQDWAHDFMLTCPKSWKDMKGEKNGNDGTE